MNYLLLLATIVLWQSTSTHAQQPACFTGTSTEVTMMCSDAGANCCTGGGPGCRWAGTATVCQNSCVGRFACLDIPTSAVIREDSCVGLSACRNTAGTSPKTTFEIGSNSCLGGIGGACFGLGLNAMSVVVGNNSCRDGNSACGDLGQNAMSVVIGNNSCVDCTRLGLNVMSVVIGNNSCRDGLLVCSDLLANTLPTELQVLIGDESCQGKEACRSLGRFLTGTAVEELIVEAGVCVGEQSNGMGVCQNCLQRANTDNLDGVDMDAATTQRLSITDSNQCPNGDAPNTFDFNLITPAPSSAPSFSAVPSGTPSSSAAPSVAPSVSAVPSLSPSTSAVPSALPSVTPSASTVPSGAPSSSATPSAAPSASMIPSGAPSSSATPSVAPSVSAVPSLPPSTKSLSGKKSGSKRGDDDNGKKGGGNMEG